MESWVDPAKITGRRGLLGKRLVARKLRDHGLAHQIITTTALAVQSKGILEEIDPAFGPWTDCAVYDVRAGRAMRMVAFERVEDAILYRLILQ